TLSIAVAPDTVDLTRGATATATVNVTRGGGFEGAVAVGREGLPAGVTASTLTVAAGANSGQVALTATASAAQGVHAVTARGTGEGVSAATDAFHVSVHDAEPQGSIGLSFSPSSVEVTQGQTATATVEITRGGGFEG